MMKKWPLKIFVPCKNILFMLQLMLAHEVRLKLSNSETFWINGIKMYSDDTYALIAQITTLSLAHCMMIMNICTHNNITTGAIIFEHWWTSTV